MVWAGDYADEELGKSYNLYTMVRTRLVQEPAATPPPRFLINLDTRDYIDLAVLRPHSDDGILHPLPLLTCDGNGRGGGDYRGSDSRIGRWARHRLAATTDFVPREFSEVDGTFIEHYNR
jgi:hypothetical protein